MKISDVAKKSGLSTRAIRLYEQRKLVEPPERRDNGYRKYSHRQLEQLILIRKIRTAGFNLDECAELMQLFLDPARRSCQVKARVLNKVQQLRQRIAGLQSIISRLDALAASCPGDDKPDCPIMDELADSDDLLFFADQYNNE